MSMSRTGLHNLTSRTSRTGKHRTRVSKEKNYREKNVFHNELLRIVKHKTTAASAPMKITEIQKHASRSEIILLSLTNATLAEVDGFEGHGYADDSDASNTDPSGNPSKINSGERGLIDGRRSRERGNPEHRKQSEQVKSE